LAESSALVELLRVLLKASAARNRVAPKLIGGSEDLERIAMEVRDSLPVHDVPASAEQLAAKPLLRITGLVADPKELSLADLAPLPRSTFTEDFRCEDNWSVPKQKWSGIRLADVLALARPLPQARYVRVGSGDYVAPISLSDARAALLCDSLNDQPLTVRNGAPWRLS